MLNGQKVEFKHKFLPRDEAGILLEREGSFVVYYTNFGRIKSCGYWMVPGTCQE